MEPVSLLAYKLRKSVNQSAPAEFSAHFQEQAVYALLSLERNARLAAIQADGGEHQSSVRHMSRLFLA